MARGSANQNFPREGRHHRGVIRQGETRENGGIALQREITRGHRGIDSIDPPQDPGIRNGAKRSGRVVTMAILVVPAESQVPVLREKNVMGTTLPHQVIPQIT